MIYPLEMTYPTTVGYVDVRITPDGWRLTSPRYTAMFRELPVAERLDLRRQFEEQVRLAKATPTKGDNE